MADEGASEVGNFLKSVNPQFESYAEGLTSNGLTTVADLQMAQDGDWQMLGIPMFHWRQIMKAVRAKFAPAEEQKNDQGSQQPAPQSVDQNQFSQIASSTKDQQTVNTTESPVRRRLVQFYKMYNPEKADDDEAIDRLLQLYQGDHTKLFQDLETKYILTTGKPKVVRKIREKRTSRSEKLVQALTKLYMGHIRPLEKTYDFPDFHSPLKDPIDFKAKPMVMMVGQYSVGKTSFIRYLLEMDFPTMRVGPEPTTDTFISIMHGGQSRVTPGNAAAVDSERPFRGLQKFGMGFLNRFNVVEVPSPILEAISLIDTPGILAGEKQRLNRNYDFAKIIRWFAFKSDRIILLFDANKLDISDEFRMAIEVLKGHDDKVRCVLNKADTVDNQSLMRVYGALLWSLGKVFKTPEVLRVYVGSFWDKPYQNDHNAELFEKESDDLLSDLRGLPRNSITRKVNEFVKRCRQLKVHLLIIRHLWNQFGMFSKDSTQTTLLNNIVEHFKAVQKTHNVPSGDFPNPNKFAEKMKQRKIYQYPKLDDKLMANLERVINKEVPKLMTMIPTASAVGNDDGGGSPFDTSNPFAMQSKGGARGGGGAGWAILGHEKAKFDTEFHKLSLMGGKASGAQIMPVMMKSGLQKQTLSKIWSMADIDRDGKMDHEEFALCLYLIQLIKTGNKLPPSLPVNLIPPGKRKLLEFSQ